MTSKKVFKIIIFSFLFSASFSRANGFYNTGGFWRGRIDAWSVPTASGLTGRTEHVAVWTGSKMIIWGGIDFSRRNTGELYDPVSNSWTATTTTGAPLGRSGATAVWTGTKMIVWGGSVSGGTAGDGGEYDPAADTWTTIPGTVPGVPATPGNPTPRMLHTAVWTGTKMLIWGGYNGGAITAGVAYDPAVAAGGGGTGLTSIPTTGSPPVARYAHTAVWSGTQMIIYGGFNAASTNENTGARYTLAGTTWATMAAGPGARRQHTSTWTGTTMITWGGFGPAARVNTGGIYDPAADSWANTATTGAVPAARNWHTATWTGSKLVVWGGYTTTSANTGGVYDPVSDSWTATNTFGAPTGRYNHTAVWTGHKVIFWGGVDPSATNISAAAIYTP